MSDTLRTVPIGVKPPGGSSGPSEAASGTHSRFALSKQLLVGGLLLLFLLMLANYYPKYAIGFMVLVLVGVVLTHADIVTNFFSI